MLTPFLRYCENTWVGDLDRRGRRRNPLYALHLWNCHDSVLNGLAKTNNSVEGSHRGFMSMLGPAHPTIFKLIASLLQRQAITETALEQAIAGVDSDPMRKRYARTASHLKNAVGRYGLNMPILTYL